MESTTENFKSRILGGDVFEGLALEIFRFQATNCQVYASYLDLLNVNAEEIISISQIPFLPVEAFRSNKVVTGDFKHEAVFKSSGTTDSSRSHHYVRSLDWYHKVSKKIYSDLIAPVSGTTWVGLLPGYLERGVSSLVEMVKSFMDESGSDKNFFLHEYPGLNELIERTEGSVTLMGVTHAILNWLEGGSSLAFDEEVIQRLTIIETGGMKGHGREPIRAEVHERIRAKLKGVTILSEYGMTELLSQAYSTDGKYFSCPPWMKILIKDTADPMCDLERGRTGRVQIIDLANVDSCSFISTSDLGRMHVEDASEQFEILGRFDHSEVRGCNLLSV